MPGLSQTVLLTPLLPFSFETPDKVELCVGPGQQLDRRKCSGCTDPAPAKRGLPSEQQWHGLEARLVDPPRGRTEPVHVAPPWFVALVQDTSTVSPARQIVPDGAGAKATY